MPGFDAVAMTSRSPKYVPSDGIDLDLAVVSLGSNLEYPLARTEINPFNVVNRFKIRVVFGKDRGKQLLSGDELVRSAWTAGFGCGLNPVKRFLFEQ